MEAYSTQLIQTFKENSNPTIAEGQKAYMKNKFEFLGIKSPLRRTIQQPFLVKQNLPDKTNLNEIVKILWTSGFREIQYFAQELVAKYKTKFNKKDIELIEFMILKDSWWDTIDFIAVHLLGNYFKKYPEEIEKKVNEYLASNNLWLQRCAILFQLKYKADIDKLLLERVIIDLKGSKEFFINKAIGWILREISKSDPVWVETFVDNNELSNLSRREALKIIRN